MEYLIQDSTLTGIANAIREKTGKTDALLPSQMASEISTITGGGGSGEDTTGYKQVLFLDYNGDIINEEYVAPGTVYTLPEFTSPHDRLVFQEWSSNLEIVNNTITVDMDCAVGAIYETKSGLTEVDVVVRSGESITLLSPTTDINWGDGVIESPVSGTSQYKHTYSKAGEYTIKFLSSSMSFIGSNSIRRIFYANLTHNERAHLSACTNLEEIVFPKDAYPKDYSASYLPPNLKHVNFPKPYKGYSVGMPNLSKNIVMEYFYLPPLGGSSDAHAVHNSGDIDDCISLKKIFLNKRCRANAAFRNLYSLESDNFLEGLKIDAGSYFGIYRCMKLKSIDMTKMNITNNNWYFSSSGFKENISLEELKLVGPTTNFSLPIFDSISLKKIEIPNNCSSIPNGGFQHSSLEEIFIPKNVSIVNNYAFNYCSFLKKIEFEEGSKITQIPTNFATNAVKLKEVNIPNTVKSIGNYAFYGTSIPELDFSKFETVPTLGGTSAFMNITSTTLYFPTSGVTGQSLVYLNGSSGLYPIIKVPFKLYDEWKNKTNWSNYASFIVPDGTGFAINDSHIVILDESNSLSLSGSHNFTDPVITITPSSDSITISETSFTVDSFSFNMTFTAAGNYTVSIRMEEASDPSTFFEKDINIRVLDTYVSSTGEVQSVEGATYGFALNDSGYYESQNKGQQNTYALCKLQITGNGIDRLILECINSGESSSDFGFLSKFDQSLSLTNSPDSSVYKNFQGQSSQTTIHTVDYGVVPAGETFIMAKYRKDGSVDTGNDSLQFKFRFER